MAIRYLQICSLFTFLHVNILPRERCMINQLIYARILKRNTRESAYRGYIDKLAAVLKSHPSA